MPLRTLKRFQAIARKQHYEWLIALGMLLALVDRRYAYVFALAAVAGIGLVSYFEVDLEARGRWMRILSGAESFCFGCLFMSVSRIGADFVLNLAHMPGQRRSAIWVAAIVFTGGWLAHAAKQTWLFGYGLSEVAWGIVIGLKSQYFLRGDASGALEVVSIVTGVFLVARGFGDCQDGQWRAKPLEQPDAIARHYGNKGWVINGRPAAVRHVHNSAIGTVRSKTRKYQGVNDPS